MIFLNLAYIVACLGSEFQRYSMDYEFAYQSLFKQWPVLELQACSYCLDIGQGWLNIGSIM